MEVEAWVEERRRCDRFAVHFAAKKRISLWIRFIFPFSPSLSFFMSRSACTKEAFNFPFFFFSNRGKRLDVLDEKVN